VSETGQGVFVRDGIGMPRRHDAPALPRGRSRRWLEAAGVALALILADLMAAVIAIGLSFTLAAVANELFDRPYGSLPWFIEARQPILGSMLVLMVAIFAFGGLYSRAQWEVDEIKRIVLASGLLGLVHGAFQTLTVDYGWRLWFVLVWPMLAFLSVVLRAAVRAIPPIRRALTRHVLLVGSGIRPDEFAYQLRESQANPVDVLEGVPIEALAGLSPEAIAAYIADSAAAAGLTPDRVQIVLAPDGAERARARGVAERLWSMGVAFSATLPLDIQARHGLRVRKITGLDMVMAEHDQPGLNRAEAALKRGMDIAVAGLALMILAPAMALIALMLWPGGGVFFAQSRVGRDGRRFECLKFRSMRPDAEARLNELLAADPAARAEWSAHQKLARDPRITPLGRFLRKTSIDELPQLINVIRGEMSLVGPRPIVAPEVEGYDNDRAYYQSPDFAWYSAMRPGITGLWQVSGRATTNYEERIRLDRWYVRNWTIWLDIAILIKTLRVVLVPRTAS